MLEFKQVEGSGPPLDIEVTTDDANAELAETDELFQSADLTGADFLGVRNLNEASPGEDGLTHFVIPGDEAGEIGDVWDELGAFLHECNQKAEAAAEAAAEAEAES